MCCMKSAPSLPQLFHNFHPVWFSHVQSQISFTFFSLALTLAASSHQTYNTSRHTMFTPKTCSYQAPYLNTWSNPSSLCAPPVTHLLSHKEINLPVTTFKEFLSSPPLLTTLAESLLPHILSSPAALLPSEVYVLVSHLFAVLYALLSLQSCNVTPLHFYLYALF